MEFEWDPNKEKINITKHEVSFTEASQVFVDTLSSSVADPDHSLYEDRYLIFGKTYEDRYLVVSFAERDDRIRLISARELTPSERKAYEQ